MVCLVMTIIIIRGEIMQNEIEEEFVRNYVKKNKQERIMWEFSNSKKRENVIWKFDKPSIFIDSCLKKIEYMSNDDMEKYLSGLCKSKKVYFFGEDFIGQLSLRESILKTKMGGICIIYCGNGIGYYQGEQEKGAPPRYLLLTK